MRILYFEDNYPFARATDREIKASYPESQITWIAYEKEMSTYLLTHAVPEVDLIIIDQMVDYQRPGDSNPEPDVVEEGGYLQAGTRVLLKLKEQDAYRAVPVAIFSNIPESDIGDIVRSSNLNIADIAIIGKRNKDELMKWIGAHQPGCVI